MAKLKAPFFSLGSSGKFGKAIVGSNWKGIDVAREYVVPANPQSAAQTTNRGYFATMVAAWRHYFTDPAMREAWNRSATAEGRKESGFNNFMRAVLGVYPNKPTAAFGFSSAPHDDHNIRIIFLALDTGGVPVEFGDFEMWIGQDPNALYSDEGQALNAGKLDTNDLGLTGEVWFVQIRRDGFNRTGIVKQTLIDP